MNNLIFILLLFIPNYLYASDINTPSGAKSAAMGTAGATLTDIASVQQNTAGFAAIKTVSGSLFYENKFLVPELKLSAFTLALPVKKLGTFGLCVNYFGFSLFNQKKTGLAFAKNLGDKFSAGVQINYLFTHIAENYGTKSAFTAEAGIQARLNQRLSIGVHLYNPTRTMLSDYNDERIPIVMKLGLAYSFSDKVTAVLESEKDFSYRPAFKFGIDYRVIKELSLRTGLRRLASIDVMTNYSILCFGFGLNIKKLTLDVASTFHPALGFTPHISLSHDFK